jgi:hypothetical protein
MTVDELDLRRAAADAGTRMDLWVALLQASAAREVGEVGVYRGDFAARLLAECDAIERYYMVDPWRHLDEWNKPANKSDSVFERFYQETMDKTQAHAAKRVVLRGRTVDVADEIADGSLDFAYIDGDHTLRGIAVDLIKLYPKVRPGGLIGGDDFCRSIWQHDAAFEPTLVFPFAVHFAEGVGAPIYALPHNQFLIVKDADAGFSFTDLTGRYGDVSLQAQLAAKASPVQAQQPPPPPPLATRVPRAIARRLRARSGRS